ncbi:hypothetical protein FRB98_009297 [Tulasnella sp. 332]|nr:hypothetical protein FRB98_009297 [Tulasnella sp. 332]
MARLSLAQQIAQLEDTVVEHDPEDAFNNTQATSGTQRTEEDDSHEGADGREHYVEVGPSMMRKMHESEPDPRYNGVKTSRSKIFDDDEDSSSEAESSQAGSRSREVRQDPADSDEDGDGYEVTQPFGKVVDESGTTTSEEDEDGDEDEGSPDGLLKPSTLEDSDKQLADALRKTREQDREKGKAVTKQLATWDVLLDARIRLQKSIVSANSLPLPEAILSFTSTDSGRTVTDKLLRSCFELSEDMFELQELLMSNNEEISPPPRKRRKVETDDNIVPSVDHESDLRNATMAVSAFDAAYHLTLIQTLSKWSHKVQSVAPTALLSSGRTTFSRSLPGQTKTAVDLIEETTSGGKAVARTRVRRAGQKGRIRGGVEFVPNAAPQVAAFETLDFDEVFDDADFYQQLLRDVIDSRAGKESLVGLDTADAWARKQKKAQKAERALANKDRRIRYDVHEKLQNYMVPVPVSRGGWHEEQIDELFASLLGKGFEGAAQEDLPKKRDTGAYANGAAHGDLAMLVDGGLDTPAELNESLNNEERVKRRQALEESGKFQLQPAHSFPSLTFPALFFLTAAMSTTRLWTREEVTQAILKGDTLVIYDTFLLRITPNWLASHPGGALAILHFVGRDATDEINAYHSGGALKRVKGSIVGRVEMDEKLGWEPLVPPVAQGWVRREGQWQNYATAVRSDGENASQRSQEDGQPAILSTEILLVAKDWTKDFGTGPSVTSITPPAATLSLAEQTRHSVAYRALHVRIQEAGLYETPYLTGYGPEFLRYSALTATSYITYQHKWFLTSALFLGLLWHQLAFIVHDLGHMGVTHNWTIDRILGISISSFYGGLSLGWWCDNHNIHHLLTNHPSHDPDIQHVPFFAISPVFLSNLYSSYYRRIMEIDFLAKLILPIQHNLYYIVLSLARFNLYANSYIFMALKAKRDWTWYMELVGAAFFWTWYLRAIAGTGDWKTMLSYLLISNIAASPVHVQIVLSHFSRSTADLGPTESFVHRQLRTTSDVICSDSVAFLHGGLHLQVTHHLFPRLPRHNLRAASLLVKEFAADQGLEYAEFGFVSGNQEVLGVLKEVANQARIVAMVAKEEVKEAKMARMVDRKELLMASSDVVPEKQKS